MRYNDVCSGVVAKGRTPVVGMVPATPSLSGTAQVARWEVFYGPMGLWDKKDVHRH